MTRRTWAVAFLTILIGAAIPCAAQDTNRRPSAGDTAPRLFSNRGMLRFSDNEGAAEGIGSRYFMVQNNVALEPRISP